MSSIESYNEAIVGPPEHRFDRDPDLAGCLAFAEPGVMAADGELFAAMFCFRSRSEQDVVLVRLARPDQAWTYAGTLLTTADAQAIEPRLIGFNGADLFTIGGAHRLLVSPTSGAYQGCIVYGLDLAAGSLVDADGGGPDPLLTLPRSSGSDVYQTGACTYHEGLATGIIYGHTHVSGCSSGSWRRDECPEPRENSIVLACAALLGYASGPYGRGFRRVPRAAAGPAPRLLQ